MILISYKFNFDLSKFPKELFEETTNFCENKKIYQKISPFAAKIVRKYNLDKIIGLSFHESKILIEDILDVQIKNKILKKYFIKADKKALFLPHCSRKYMDSNCKAEFIKETSSYACKHCSKDCMVSQATNYAKKEGYDVYILPGASCLSKIFEKERYEGIVGVACTEEIKLAMSRLIKLKIPSQAVPLIKNGCSCTSFDFETLKKTMSKEKKLEKEIII